MVKKSRVTIEGMEALTITEARCLIMAAMAGRTSQVFGPYASRELTHQEIGKVESACEKIAESLILAGQKRGMVEKLLGS